MANEAIIKFDTSRTLTVNCYYDNAGAMTKRNAEAIAMTEEPVSSGIYKATVPNIAAGDLIEYLDAEYGWIGDEVYAPLQTATLDTIKAETASIVADTNEIQGKLPTNKIMGSSDVDNHDIDIASIKTQMDKMEFIIGYRVSGDITPESAKGDYIEDGLYSGVMSYKQAGAEWFIFGYDAGQGIRYYIGSAKNAQPDFRWVNSSGNINGSYEALILDAEGTATVTAIYSVLSKLDAQSKADVNAECDTAISGASLSLESTSQSIKTKTDALPDNIASTLGGIAGYAATSAENTDNLVENIVPAIPAGVRTNLLTELGRIDASISSRNAIAPATPTNVSDAQMAIINAMPDISGLNDISVQDILGASISDDSGATITIQKAIRIMTAWSVGNWRNKSGSNTIRELLDADDGETVILDMVLSRTTPFRTITVRI
jgi:hypothetical protein